VKSVLLVIFISFMVPDASGLGSDGPHHQVSSLPVSETQPYEGVDDSVKENAVFRSVKSTGTKGHYTVRGEARPSTGSVYYSVEDGHNQFIKETKVDVPKGGNQWQSFELHIDIPEEVIPANGSIILFLYEKRESSGTNIHEFSVILESIY
jgi:hypothetical protein